MRRQTCFALVLAALAGPALALSCLRPDVVRTYQSAAAAEEAYVVVQGTLDFDGRRLPKADASDRADTPPSTRIPARITGQALTRTGFDQTFDREITLDLLCFGPWCAGAKSGIPYLAFLRKTDTGYVLQLDPCGGFGFAEPTGEMLTRVEGCYRGRACKPAR